MAIVNAYVNIKHKGMHTYTFQNIYFLITNKVITDTTGFII